MPSNTFLRFIAIVCIVNSHLDTFYPMPELATGGSIGNALFFMISGYGLFLSTNIKNMTFLLWYKRRILRIYPSLLITLILMVVIMQSGWRTLDVFDYVKLFIWPTPYWFISALMIFYIIFFIISKRNNYKYFFWSICILIIPYIYFYLTSMDLSCYSIEGWNYFKWLFYLQTMFFGGYLAGCARPIKTSFIKDGFALLCFVTLYYGILIFMSKFGGWQFQAVTHLLVFPILFFFLRFANSAEIISFMKSKYVGAAISIIAAMTLEIYLLHGSVRYISFVNNLIFPMNIAVFWIVTIALSYVLYRVANEIRKMATSG